MPPLLKHIILGLVAACTSLSVQGGDRQVITLSVLSEPDQHLYIKWVTLLYTQAFERLGVEVQYQVLPALRSSLMTDAGTLDGESARVEGYGAAHPNLVRIEEPLIDTYMSAFAVDPKIKVNSWQDLADGHYKVEHYRGAFIATQRLSQFVRPERLTTSSYPVESLRKLARGRIDVYVESDLIAKQLLRRSEFVGKNIRLVANLERFAVYGYLHKRHGELALSLADVLRQMKQQGLFESLFEQAEAQLAQPAPPG